MKNQILSQAMKIIGSRGGKSTAKKYSKEQLAEWGRMGAKAKKAKKNADKS